MKTLRETWKCPVCKKEFARKNQSHKCEVVDVQTLFHAKDEMLFKLYEYLFNSMRRKRMGDWIVTTSSKAITIYAASKMAFMGIEVKKTALDIWFVLGRKVDEFPVFRILQPAKNKFGHFVRIHDKEDIDELLLSWIEESYHFINKRK